MGSYYEEGREYDDEKVEEEEEKSPESDSELNLFKEWGDTPHVEWEQDIEMIEDPQIRQREREAAEKIVERENEVHRKM